MTALKIENQPLPDGHYTVTYHHLDGTVRQEEGVTKDKKLIAVWKYGEGDEPGEPEILAVTESTVLRPGERARVLPQSYGERGLFTVEAVAADRRMIVDGEEQIGPGWPTTINGVTITQVKE